VFYVHFQHGDCERRVEISPGDTCLIGRTPDADFFLNHGSVSRRHCRLIGHKQGVEFQDLGSRNGCVYNGMRIDRVFLGEQAILQIGRLTFSVKMSTPELPVLRCERCAGEISDWRILGHSVSASLICEACIGAQRAETPDRLKERLVAEGFEIEEVLSRDPLVVVALRSALGRRFRIKAIDVQPEEADIEVERFKQEARIAASLEHQGIVKVIDIRTSDEIVYVLMEHDGSETLRQRIEKSGPFPVAKALAITRSLLSALQYAAERDVLHHNLTPDAILFSSQDKPRLFDFKLGGWRLDLKSSVHRIEDATEGFLAPDLFLGHSETDCSPDLFGIGALFVFMVTGRPPYLGTSMGIARAALLKMSVDPSLKGVPTPFRPWLRGILSLDSKFRPATHDEALRGLNDAAMTFLMPDVVTEEEPPEQVYGKEFSGSFVGDQLVEIFRLLELHMMTGLLEVFSGSKDPPARILVVEGGIASAHRSPDEGEAALRAIFSLRQGSYVFQPQSTVGVGEPSRWKISSLLYEVGDPCG